MLEELYYNHIDTRGREGNLSDFIVGEEMIKTDIYKNKKSCYNKKKERVFWFTRWST